MSVPEIRDALAAQGLWYGRLCTASSTAIIVYDHLITLDDELRLIWKSRWSAGKVLFLISRYYNVFIILFNTSNIVSYSSKSSCFVWLRWQAVSGICIYGVTEIILMLRLYAMYSSNKKILVLMITGFTFVIVAEIIIVVLSTQAQIGPVNADPHLKLSMETCILTDTWPLSYIYWIPFLAFETLLFALALVKGYLSVRDHELQQLHLGFCGSRAAKALEVLIRDSVLYFMLIFAVYLTNVLAWTIDGGRIGEIPVALAVALSTVMAQRLLLNIRLNFERRQAGTDMDADTGMSDTIQLSTIAFDGLPVLAGGGGAGSETETELEYMEGAKKVLVDARPEARGRRRAGSGVGATSTMSKSTAVSP